MKLFSVNQIRKWDTYTINNEPISSIDLMERASISVSNWILNELQIPLKKILILVGNGNNGGDGLAVGRILTGKGIEVEYYCLKNNNRSNDNSINILKSKVLKINFLDHIIDSDYSIIIDAIFGSGLSREIEGEIKKIVLLVNTFNAIKISIDCPSGIHAEKGPLSEIVFKADHTLTFQAPKMSFFYRESSDYIGQTHVLDIGLAEEFSSNVSTSYHLIDEEMSQLPNRKKFSHKGTYGHSLIIAGEMGKMGACLLAAKASLRSGSGLTTILAPANTQEILQSSIPEAMTIPYNENASWNDLLDINKYTAIGIGPGIGNHPSRAKQLLKLLPEIKRPIVLDADALNIISENKSIYQIPGNSILTPHPGEFYRLFGKCNSTMDYIKLQKEISIKQQVIIVHKLANTIISDTAGNIYFNNTGNPGMATAGSGDVLTGIITGLLAQNITPIKSALIGVYQHGISGDICKKKRSEANMIASDLIENLFIK